MTAVSDAMVLGVVLGLVFAAVSYYLYSMIGQLSRKVNVMENILLDLKVATEQTILSGAEPLEAHQSGSHSSSGNDAHPLQPSQEPDVSPSEIEQYRQIVAETSTTEAPVQEATETASADVRELSVEQQSTRTRSTTSTVQVEREKAPAASSSSTTYESMKYFDLLALARSKGLPVSKTTTKPQVIQMLRESEGAATPAPVQRQQTGLESWTTSNVLSFDENTTELGGGTSSGPADLSSPELTLVGSE